MKYFFTLITVAVFNVVFSQAPDKVTVSDLKEKSHPIDSSAVAAVLYNAGKTTFNYTEKYGFSAVHAFTMRIKIYKKEGLAYANYEVPYYVGYENLNPDILDITDAVTYNLVDGKVEKTRLGSEGKFRERVNKHWKTVTITLPNAKVGSVIEFTYKLKSENLLEFPTFIFQRDIPVNYVSYRTEIPVTYGYKQVIKGLFRGIETKSVVEANSIDFHNFTTRETDMLDFNQVTTTFTGKNIAPLKEENYVDNMENYRAAVDYELEVIREEDEKNNKYYSKTWEDVAKKIYEDKDFGTQTQLREYFLAELKLLIKDVDDHDKRLELIYGFVKSRMNWNEEFRYTAEKGVQKAWLDRTGNSAEINFILMAMLNSAGILSYPVLVSTVKNGVPVYPNQTGFNYVVVASEYKGKRILLDACDKNAAPGILPLYTLNWNGRLIKKDGNSEEIPMEPGFTSKSQTTIMAAIEKNGVISGQARIYKTAYEAFDFRSRYAGANRTQYLEYLENSLHNIDISNYKIENDNNPEEPLQQTFDFSAKNSCEVIGDRIYFSPMLFLNEAKNPFTQKERSMPVFFGYPKSHKIIVTLKIPEGYSVESIPAALFVNTPENVMSFKYNAQQTQDRIQITLNIESNKMLVSPDFYGVLLDYYKKIVEKQNEKIVLKKV